MHARSIDRLPIARMGRALLPLAAALLPLSVAAQPPLGPAGDAQLVRESWTVRDGLPVNATTRVLQGSDGYLWTATFNGLVRFDGVRFTVFDPADTPGLPSGRIVRLVQGAGGRLWLVTDQGHLVRFDGRTAATVPGTGQPGRKVNEVLVDGEMIWAATDSGVATVRGDRLVPVGRGEVRGLVVTMAVLPDGSLLAGEMPGAVVHLDRQGRLRRRFVLRRPGGGLAVPSPNAIHADDDGTLLLGWLGGLATGRLDRDTLDPVALPAFATGPATVLSISRRQADGSRWIIAPRGVLRWRGDRIEIAITAAEPDFHPARHLDDERGTWFGVDNVLYRDGRPVHTIPVAPDEPRSAVRIVAVHPDREGSIWLGTTARGLHRLSAATFRSYAGPDGFGTDNVYSVIEDHAGTVWVGTWGLGLARFDAASGRATVFGTEAGAGAFVHTLIEERPGTLLLGTNNSLRRCRTAGTVRCERDAGFALDDELYALVRDRAGTLWAGARSGLWRQEGARWVRMPWSPAAPVRALADTPDGATWFATNGAGLLRRDRDGRTRSIGVADGLPIDVVRELFVDDAGMLWVGTEGRGLARLDPRAWGATPVAGADRRIARIGVAHGLPDEVVHRILPDGAGRVWLSTNRGIMRVALHELQAVADGRATRVLGVVYTERDGLRNREANGGYWPAGTRTRDGRLWFPTQGGLAVVDPRRLERGVVPGLPRADAIVTRARTIAIVDADTTPIALTAEERDLEFRFTAPHFLEPAALRFRYRLDPYDTDWVEAGARRTAFYTRVPPGRYTFRVAVADGGGRWQVATVPTSLAIATQFSETGLARLLALASLACLVAAAFRWRETTLRRRAAELARLVDARTAALSASERELAARNAQLAEQAAALEEHSQARTRLFTYLSHEFRTPLTLILGPLQGLLEGRYGALPSAVEGQTTLMQRNAQRLLRLVNQILDLARLQSGAVVLDRRRLDFIGFVRGVVAGFTPLAEQRGIALAFETERAMLRVAIDGEQFEKVLLNLIGNALKFTPAAGQVVVRVLDDGWTVKLVVEDTGIGIPAAELPYVFDRFYRARADGKVRRGEGTGIGLALVREVVERHGGKVSVESVPGEGSRFTVALPIAPWAVELPIGGDRNASDTQRLASAVVQHGSGEYVAEVPALLTDPRTGEAIVPEASAADDALTLDEPDRTTVLVVDDNADVCAYVRSVLGSAYRVFEAPDGARALALTRAVLPDVVIADVMMPELDGFGLVRALRDDGATDAIAVVLLTAKAGAAAQVAGYEAGADAYLVKPFEPSVLEACVGGLLAQRRRLRDRFRSDPTSVSGAMQAVTIGAASTEAADDTDDADGAASDAEGGPSALQRELRAIIVARLTDPTLAPETLAAAAGRSYHQLYRALQAELGWSPSRFIRSVRVECAAELLRQGRGSVTEVAYAVGFESLSYFGRAFRERFGANPGSFAAKGVSAARGGRAR